jgi:PTS system nitrogen regulatory IIA component
VTFPLAAKAKIMADDDFDIERLAAYLHVDPVQVAKLADRGRLPGRRVGGQWRFSPATIHHWLEERMGLSTDDELKQMETALRRPPGGMVEAQVSLAAMLPLEAIAIPLAARTRQSVIGSMCELAAQTHWLWDAPKMVEAVRMREDLCPTALDNGAALLHPRRPLEAILDRPFLALGRTARGIPFGGAKDTLTDIFFLILSIEDRGHLQVLARLSRLLADATFLTELRGAADARTAHGLVARYEIDLPA